MYLVSVSKPPALTAKAALRQNLKDGLERQRLEKLRINKKQIAPKATGKGT